MQAIDALIASTYREDEYPVSLHQTERWGRTRPLQGLVVLDSTPIFRNTLVKYRALMAAGAELIVGISDVISHDEDILELLRQSGIRVATPQDAPLTVDIILDCAASFSKWQPRIGFVELTRSGVDKFANVNKPVFVADSGRIKRIETCLGTGESYYRAMKQLGYDDWNGRKLVVFGCGKVGTGIITYAHKLGAQVTVITDPDSAGDQIRALSTEIIAHWDTPRVEEAVKDAYAVVTATGIPNVLERSCSPQIFIDSPALLANMGAEDEYGASFPDERVLRGKQTLNFILDEPTHLKYIDATMALHNEGAHYLIMHPEAYGLIEPPSEMEEHLLDVCRRKGCISAEIELI